MTGLLPTKCNMLSGAGRLKPQIRQPGMVVGTPAGGPEILAVGFDNRQVVDARDAPAHQAVLIELPKLVAIGAKPVAAVVMPFVGEPHRHPVVAKPPQLLDEPVVEFLVPFA